MIMLTDPNDVSVNKPYWAYILKMSPIWGNWINIIHCHWIGSQPATLTCIQDNCPPHRAAQTLTRIPLPSFFSANLLCTDVCIKRQQTTQDTAIILVMLSQTVAFSCSIYMKPCPPPHALISSVCHASPHCAWPALLHHMRQPCVFSLALLLC